MRAVSMDLVTPAPVEHCAPRGESFADTLKVTLQVTDPTTPDSDAATASQGDYEAALALLGALTPMCTVSPPPATLGLSRLPPPVEEQPSVPETQQPGGLPGDQRVLPITGEIASPPSSPPGPLAQPSPIGDTHIHVTPLPVQPSPTGDTQIYVTPLPVAAPVVAEMPADAAVLPTDLAQAGDEAGHRADVAGGDTSISATGAEDQPVSALTRSAAADSGARSQETVRSTSAPAIEVARVPDHSRPRDLVERSDGQSADLAPAGTDAIAMTQAGITERPAGDTTVKAARSLAQLSTVVSDIAQQARTESSPRRVVIPLDPPALGHVTVEIIVRADSVRVSLQHGDASAFNALNAQRPAIEAALESNGLHLSGFDVSGNNRQRASQLRNAARHFEALVEQIQPDGALRL